MCSGIDPTAAGRPPPLRGFPRVRGDRPFAKAFRVGDYKVPPRPRGYAPFDPADRLLEPPHPACAGIASLYAIHIFRASSAYLPPRFSLHLRKKDRDP